MAIPDEIHDWLEEDVQGLIWNKTPVFDPDEDGTQIENKRFMLKDAQYGARSMLGLGLMNWRAHVKAMQIKAILDYRNATRSDYKKILNEWIEPNWGSDDMLFYNIRNKADSLRLPVPLRSHLWTFVDTPKAHSNSGEGPKIRLKRW